MTAPTKRAGIAGQVFAWAWFVLVIGWCVWSTLWRMNSDYEAHNWHPPANPVIKTVSGHFTDVTLTKSYRYGYHFVTGRGEAMSFSCEAGGAARGLHYHDCLTHYPEDLRDRPITLRYYEASVHSGSKDMLILGIE